MPLARQHHAPINRTWAARGAASGLWAALDEATRVAERGLTEDPAEWWIKMGHTAQVPLQVAARVVGDEAAVPNSACGGLGQSIPRGRVPALHRHLTNHVTRAREHP